MVARAFKKEEVNDIFFQPIKKVDQGKKAWRIRYSLVECLALLINYLEKEVIRKEVADCFEELLKDAETEVRAIALIKLPELTQKLSNNQSYQTFFQYLERAAKEPTKDAPLTIKMALL